MSLFSILQTSTRGLFAAQLGMDVAGQNVSNADVEGYSRKRLNMTADYRYDGEFGQMGFGVNVINIQRMRDTLVDQQIRSQNQQMGVYEEHDNFLQQVESIFTEPSDQGLQTYIDKFFDSWQNLTQNPADVSARTMVKTSAETLTDVMHSLSGEVTKLHDSINSQVSDKVAKVNELAKEISNLNGEVGIVEINNQKANDSRDRRDKLLKDLSKIIDIDTFENSQGQVTVTTGGSVLVSPVGYRTLETTTTTFTMPDGTTQQNIGIRFADSKRVCTPTSGEIKGLYDCRDQIIPQYQRQLDTLATALVQKVNELHERGYNLMGYSGLDFFDPSVTGASDIRLSPSIVSDVQNIAAASGGDAAIATANVFPAGVLDFGAVTTPALLSKTGNVAPPPTGNDIARNVLAKTVTVTAGGTLLTENADYHIDYVNGTIQMLHAGYNGQQITVNFQYQTGGSKGPGDNANAVLIAQLRQALTMAPDALGNPTSTFAQYYSAFIGKLGLNRNEATSSLETSQFLVKQYEDKQDSVAGVSLDEEMADIVKYQHTYQAAARVISTTSVMLDTLINMAA